ncbi:MAG: T9SS type A sorting domain-containing protein [Bacteroidales bacterium]|nr:T9SS type A sorting domain-containing protein [Bacteroidales bacterium]
MKQLFLLLFSTFLVFTVTAQQVEREMVILEIATGTWCYYCPGSAMGADDLIENGDDVAVIEYHDGDPFANSYAASRINFYNVSGFPTAVFDGDITYVGGNHTQSLFNAYHNRYEYRKDIPSSFTLDIFGQAEGDDYSILLVAKKVADYDGSNLVAHLALTESHIEYSWQGMSEVNFVERLMVPDQYGSEIDFSASNIQYVELDFTFDDEWVAENSELVTFIQDNDSEEIQQGAKVALNDLEAAPALANFSASTTEACEGDVVDFTDESYGDPTTYTWLFEGGTPQMSSEPNPSITYEEAGTYDVTLEVSDGNNEHSITMEGYITVEDCTGLDEKDNYSLSVWPNPANEALNINGGNLSEEVNLKIYDVSGKLVLENQNLDLSKSNQKLNISHLKQGVYFLEITGNEAVKREKIVIE